MKQLEPTKADHYITEHQPGETVSGRIAEVHGNRAKVELAEGVTAVCQLKQKEEKAKATESGDKTSDVSALSAMLAARWKQGPAVTKDTDTLREGQVRNFRIVAVNPEKKQIEIELAG
jgi:ribosomal protein S1